MWRTWRLRASLGKSTNCNRRALICRFEVATLCRMVSEYDASLDGESVSVADVRRPAVLATRPSRPAPRTSGKLQAQPSDCSDPGVVTVMADF